MSNKNEADFNSDSTNREKVIVSSTGPTGLVVSRGGDESCYVKLQQSVLNALSDSVALLDDNGFIVLVNEAWKKMATGSKPAYVNYGPGVNYTELVESSDCKLNMPGRDISQGIRQVISGAKSEFSLQYICHTSTDKKWLEVKVSPIHMENEMRGAMLMFTDITNRKLVEETLRMSQSNLAAIIDSTNDLIYSLDRDFRYITFNSAHKNMMQQVLGIEIQPGDKVFGFLEETNHSEAVDWERIYSEILTGKTRQFIKEYSHEGKPVYFRFSAQPIWKDNAVVGISCFVRNITLKKLAADKIKELNDSLELKIIERTAELSEANKELETFSYTVSHDLRAPLRTMVGFSRILLKDHSAGMKQEAKEMLGVIDAGARRLDNLVQDLLNFSKAGKGSICKKQVSMSELVISALHEMQLVNKEPKVAIHIGALEDAECDNALVKQVWINLISNAVKYSSKKTHPKVEIGITGGTGSPVYFVKDNGTGFDMTRADRLFSPFQRMHTDNDFEGTGIGLATVHRIIERHGGRVWAEAKENEGATFYFTIKQ